MIDVWTTIVLPVLAVGLGFAAALAVGASIGACFGLEPTGYRERLEAERRRTADRAPDASLPFVPPFEPDWMAQAMATLAFGRSAIGQCAQAAMSTDPRLAMEVGRANYALRQVLVRVDPDPRNSHRSGRWRWGAADPPMPMPPAISVRPAVAMLNLRAAVGATSQVVPSVALAAHDPLNPTPASVVEITRELIELEGQTAALLATQSGPVGQTAQR